LRDIKGIIFDFINQLYFNHIMGKLNTHFYDGKLNPRFLEIQKSIPNPLPLEQTYREIKALINTTFTDQPQRKKQALAIIKRLKNDRGKVANHDQKNKIHVDQLLPLVWTQVKEYDATAKLLFLEQLIEIRGGMCPQGRTTRLIQMIELPPDDQSNNDS